MRNILLCIILIVVGCTPPAAYTAFMPVSIENWTETAHFQVNTPTSSLPHTLYICVRTTDANRYDTCRLPLEITQKWEHTNLAQTDTLMVTIVDSIGNWKGKGIYHRDIITPHSPIQTTDTLRGSITIRPLTKNAVHGVSHIGIEIRKEERGKERGER